MITARDKAKEAARELQYRRHVYARLVETGRMTSIAASRRIAIMTEIHNDYERQAESEEAKERLL